MPVTASILEPLRRRMFAATPSDAELLQQYATAGDGEAFRALVERHGPLVLGAARRVAGEAHADDVFQAAFLTLARTPSKVRCPGALAVWLHRTAFRLALCARRAERRRHAAERRYPAPATRNPLDELSVREFLAVLDSEIERLPEADRAPLILCCLDGLSLDEAASRLGTSRDAVKGRLERSRLRLRRNLAKRGITVAVALGAGLLVTPPTVARPLLDSTVAACLGPAAVPASVSALLAAPRPRLWVALVVGILGLGVGWIAVAKSPAPPPPAVPAKPAADPLPPGVVARLGVRRLPVGVPMAFATDSRTFVGLHDSSLIRFDAETGTEMERIPFPKRFFAGQLSNDGRTAVTLGIGDITVWDVEARKPVVSIPPPIKYPSLALSADGKRLVINSLLNDPKPTYRLAFWDLTMRTERAFDLPAVNGMMLSPDGNRLLVWLPGPTLSCWDVAGGRIAWKVTGSRNPLVFAPAGKTIFRYGPGQEAGALDAATGKPVDGFKLPSEESYSSALAAPDNRTLLLPTRRGLVVWDMKEGREIRVIPWPGPDISWEPQLVGPFAPDGKSFLANFGVLQRYDLATGKPLWPDTTDLGHTAPASSFAFSPDGKWLASGSWKDYTIRIWELATGRLAHTLHGHTAAIRTVAFTPDSRGLVSGGADSSVRVWDVATGAAVHVLALHDGRNRNEHQHVAMLRIAPDGRRVTVTAREGSNGPMPAVLSVWDIVAGKRLDRRRNVFVGGPGTSINMRPLTGDGAMFLDSGQMIDAAGTAVRPPPPLLNADQNVHGTALSADERLAAGWVNYPKEDARRGDQVLVWEVATGRPVARLAVTSTGRLAFTPNGLALVTVSSTGIRTWDLRTARAVRTHPANGPANGPLALVVSPDGRTAATGSLDGTILLWDVAPPKAVAAPLTGADCSAAWADIASPDAAKGFAAVCCLADDPKQSLPFLKDRLRPVAPPPAGEINALLGDLSSPQFKTRDAAEKALRSHGDRIEAILRNLLKANPPAETKKRIDAILASFADAASPEGEVLRGVRAVWTLERIGTPEARRLLTELATGVESARLTREAKAALGR